MNEDAYARTMPAHVKMMGYNRSGTDPLRLVLFNVRDPDTPYIDPVHLLHLKRRRIQRRRRTAASGERSSIFPCPRTLGSLSFGLTEETNSVP